MHSPRYILRHTIVSLGFVLLYLLLSRPEVVVIPYLGFVMWYPAIGLALALMLAVSPWYTPLVAFSITAAGFLTYQQPLNTYGETIGAAAIAVCYAAAAYMLRGKLRIDLRLRRRKDVVRYVFVTITAALVSTASGTACLVADHSIAPKEFWPSASAWFFGDAIGVLGVAPFFLIHVFPPVCSWLGYAVPGINTAKKDRIGKGFSTSVLLEALAQVVTIAGLVALMCAPGRYQYYFFLSFIPVIWIAMRQGIRRAVTGVVVLNFAIVVASNLAEPPIALLGKITLCMLVVSAAGLIVGSEVSERYRTAIELNEQTTYLNALIQNNPLGIVVFDRQGRVEMANVAFGKLLQYDQRDLSIGDIATLWLVGMPTVLPQALCGTPSHTTVRQKRKDGKLLDLGLHAVPLLVNGKVHGAYAIYEDISEQVRASEAERKHAESLNQLVTELQIHTNHLTFLNEMGGRLEVCISDQDASKVVGECAQKFFPEALSGTLYLLRSHNVLEAASHWGGASVSEPIFRVDACHASTQRQALWSGNAEDGSFCPHLRRNAAIKSLCAPIIVVNNLLGILHLEFGAAAEPTDPGTLTVEDSQKRLAVSMAGQVARSFTSLRLRQTLREQSIRDPLTGLFNRRFMEESLEKELKRAERGKYPVSLLFFDLDHFKRFNDSFGHDAGDQVLRSIAELVRSFFRAGDICCRFGGEEFAIILPEMSPAIAGVRGNALRTEIKHLELRHLDKALGEVSISVGVATFPEHGKISEELFRMADQALYESKAQGRDRVTIAAAKVSDPA